MSSVAMTKQTAGAGAARAVARKRARPAHNGKGGAAANRHPGRETGSGPQCDPAARAHPCVRSRAANVTACPV